MWALGCLLYTLCYGTHPFASATQLQIVNANVRYPQAAPGGQPVNPVALAILQALLQQQVPVYLSFSPPPLPPRTLIPCRLPPTPPSSRAVFHVVACLFLIILGSLICALPSSSSKLLLNMRLLVALQQHCLPSQMQQRVIHPQHH
jgi:serine/threonine protein kinase